MKFLNIGDFLKIGLMAFLFILAFNAFLRKAGMDAFTTSGGES